MSNLVIIGYDTKYIGWNNWQTPEINCPFHRKSRKFSYCHHNEIYLCPKKQLLLSLKDSSYQHQTIYHTCSTIVAHLLIFMTFLFKFKLNLASYFFLEPKFPANILIFTTNNATTVVLAEWNQLMQLQMSQKRLPSKAEQNQEVSTLQAWPMPVCSLHSSKFLDIFLITALIKKSVFLNDRLAKLVTWHSFSVKFKEKRKIHKILRVLSIITAYYFIVLRADSWLKYCTFDREKTNIQHIRQKKH